MPPALPESAVLLPRDPSILDTNQWPDFPLTHVDIYSTLTGESASLLDADANTPLTIIGKLDRVPKDRLKYFLDGISPPLTIRLDNILTYCYGQYEDGTAALWAAGAAGWFEIKPSRAYRYIFRHMVEAVDVFYFIADIYRELKRPQLRKVEVERIFESYAEEREHKCLDAERASEIILKHRMFLIEMMRGGKEDIAWKQTSIYALLESEQEESTPPNDSPTAVDTLTTKNDATVEEADVARLAREGKSALRPRSSKHSMKGAGRRSSTQNDQTNGDTTSTIEDDTSLIRAPSPLKRKRTQPSSTTGLLTRRQKRLSTNAHDEGSTLLLAFEDTTKYPLTLLSHARPKSNSTSNQPRNSGRPITRMIASVLPSYDPQETGDIWTCTFEGCCQSIYAASTATSRELIKEHYRSHGVKAQAQLNLVHQEERAYLPVGNLIKKIREMAALQAQKGVEVKEERA